MSHPIQQPAQAVGPSQLRPVRRIVTATNAHGRSYIRSDGPTPNVVQVPGRPFAQVLWATGKARAAGDEPAPEGYAFPFHSPGGSLLRIADFIPDALCDQRELLKFLDESGVRDGNAPRHFWFHKTQSLDYAIVLEGEIYALMDEDEVLMRPGDVLIQRATNHSWSNRSGNPCRVAFVLLDLTADEPL